MSTPAAGWYDDPAPGAAPGAQRFWDGSGWTEQTRYGPADLTKQATPSAYAPAGQAQPYGAGAPVGHAPGAPQVPPVAMTHTPDGMVLASPGKRLAAALVDGLILTVVSFVIVLVFVLVVFGGGAAAGVFDTSSQEPPPGFVLLFLGGYALVFAAIVLISVWYYLIRVRQVGATPGKQMLGLRIRTFHTDGQLTWAQALGRWGLVSLVSQFTGGVAGIVDVLWLLWDKHRQCLHDKAVGTVVVDTTAPRAPEQHPGVQLARAFPAQRGWVADGPNPQTPAGYPR